ncbi:MAG: hypothetical protein ABEN55_08630, partial [Bradymonadaceae bacterium]
VKQFKFRDNLMVKADKPIAVGQFMVGSWYPGRDEQCKAPSPLDPEGETRGCKVQTMCDDGTTRIGDPAFLLNVSTSQFLEEYVIRIPKSYQEDWINIVAPEGASIQVDGSAVSGSGQAISGTKWRIYQKKVSPGVHRIKSTGGKKFGLYGYGYGCDVSYAYPGGLDLGSNSGP